MVITFVKDDGVQIVGIVFDTMPHKDPMGWNVTIEGYAQYVKMRGHYIGVTKGQWRLLQGMGSLVCFIEHMAH